jgi:alpha-L-rhamnosidase
MKQLSLILVVVLAGFSLRAEPDSLADSFQHPPAPARPWVYWFWNNGNVTSNGITADLEAMQRVGIGGVLIMDVLERFAPPRGTAEFMNPEWQNLFEFSVQETARLGLEINMANGPGWCGSSGPWITPELSMQKLVWTNLIVTGPTNFSTVLPRPALGNRNRDHFDSQIQFKDYYEDIALLAFPVPTNGAVSTRAVVNLSAKLGADGKLHWSVPTGQWVLQRIGHTTTGSSTRPPVAGGNGLECDKLSAAAMDAHFAGMMAKLIKTAGPLAGKSLVATHIDSWEVGSQNWTPKLREEFQKRRGYDLLPWLPCLTGAGVEKTSSVKIGDAAMTARFRWDFAQTISELLAENYSGRLAELARKNGLRYSLEGYDLPFGDEFTYTARADEPMTEFWTAQRPGQGVTYRKAVEMASVAHVYGHAICGAESFTSGDNEMWKLTPADIKALGDFEFSQGVNRFVVHRYAHQPYLDRVPGATMGPWGLHYERTQTWWEMSGAWHEYLARCQYLLRQGKFVADVLYLRPEVPNQTYFNPVPAPPAGYRYDEISAEALGQRVSVKNGKLVLPDGMNYRVLVLPPMKTMTPALARKIRELISAGATVYASAASPAASPSLQDFPKCDDRLAKLGHEIWGDCNGQTVTAHSLGKGKLIWGQPLETVLAGLAVSADFSANVKLNWIHRQADGAEIYFVANPENVPVEARCTFRVKGLRPELWHPETGTITPLACFEETTAGVTLSLRFEPSESAFVVFRQSAEGFDPVVSFRHNGEPLPAPAPLPVRLEIQKAVYGVPGDAARSRDVRAQVQALVDAGKTTFKVTDLAEAGDPAYGVEKTFTVEYTGGGQLLKATGKDPNTVSLCPVMPAPERPAEIVCDSTDNVQIVARETGSYDWVTATGRTHHDDIAVVPLPLEITGPWDLNFPPKWGAPASVVLTNLISWTDVPDNGVKFFSGTATYVTTFNLPADQSEINRSKFQLALGEVQVMARVKLNGQDCGIAWKPPYQVDVSRAIRSGQNRLEISVANLWPNRMIGDAALPEDQRFTWSSWEPFKASTPLLKSGLLGPVKILETTP